MAYYRPSRKSNGTCRIRNSADYTLVTAYINEEFARVRDVEERNRISVSKNKNDTENGTENNGTGKDSILSIGERSLKEVLKEVLKEADYKKVLPIAELIDEQGSVSPSEAKAACGKSDTTTWRYLGILVETGLITSEGETNKKVYRRI